MNLALTCAASASQMAPNQRSGVLMSEVEPESVTGEESPRRSARLTRALAFVLAAVAALWPLWLIATYGPRVPFQDEFSVLDTLQRVQTHRLTFTSLWQPHNEHRIFFPRLILAALAWASHWDSQVMMVVSWFAMTGAFFVIFVRLWRATDVGLRPWSAIAVVVAAGWFFSPAQQENWLWGFQLAFFLVQVSTVLSLAALTSAKPTAWRLTFAVVFGVIATFSAAQGLIVWPALLVTGVCFARTNEERLEIMAVLAGVAAVVGSAYLVNYHVVGSTHLGLRVLLGQSLNLVRFFVGLLGAPLAFGVSSNLQLRFQWACALGFLLLVTYFTLVVLSARRKLLRHAAFWVGLGVFSLGFCVITTYGRMQFGLTTSASTSRYITHEALFPIAIIGLASSCLGLPQARSWWSRAIGSVVAAGLVLASGVAGVRTGRQEKRELAKAGDLLPLLPYMDPAGDGSPASPYFAFLPLPGAHIYQEYLEPYLRFSGIAEVAAARFWPEKSGLTTAFWNRGRFKGFYGVSLLAGRLDYPPDVSPDFVLLKEANSARFFTAVSVNSARHRSPARVISWSVGWPTEKLASLEQVEVWMFDRKQNAFLRAAHPSGVKITKDWLPDPRSQADAAAPGIAVIDAVNGGPLPANSVVPAERVTIKGWAAVSPQSGIAGDRCYLFLFDPAGRFGGALLPETEARPDVAQAFRQPNLIDAGFRASVNLKGRTGCRLQVWREYQNRFFSCGAPVLVGE